MRIEPMRICSPHCGFDPIDSGGAIYEREILVGLARLGVDLHLPMPQGKVVPETLSASVEPVRFRRWRWWLAAPFVAQAVRSCWGRHGFDVLRAHAPRFVGPGCLLARPRGIPFVAHHHHLDGIWQERVDLAVLRRADLVTTDSEASRQALRQAGITVPIELCSPGIGKEFFVEPHVKTGRTLLFVGGFKARKNPEILPTILRRVLDRGGLAELVLVGDGPQRQEVERRTRRLKLDQGVHLLGRVPDASKPAIYARADVFVFPSRMEGFGMPLLEAMAAGLPVVASSRGALPELVEDGRTGFLVEDPDDADAFAERIVILLKSPKLRAEMGLRARAEAAGRLWGQSARRLDALYRGLL